MSSLASSVCAPVLLLALLSSVAVADEEVITGDVKSTNTWQAFKALLTTQRKAQMEAIKHLLSINHNEKQHDMLNIMTRKLLETLAVARQRLTTANFSAEDDFPQDESLRDELSKLIQNTLLFGDMALRFPAFMHRVYDSDQTIRQLIKWSFDFVSNTKITEGTNAEQTIPMASQELNMVERDANFVNPFTHEEEIKLSELVKQEMKKSKTKKKKKGPRLSGAKTEL